MLKKKLKEKGEYNMNRKILMLTLLWIMLFSSVSMVLAAEPPKNINSGVVGTIGEPATVDPAWLYDTASAELAQNVYDALVWFEVDRTLGRKEAGKSGEFVPALATQWEISADGKTYTFKMRDDVEWHDGTVSTAAQMAANAEYSMERWMIFDRTGGPAWMIIEPVSGGALFGAELTVAYATMVDAAVEDFTNATGSYLQLNLGMSYPPLLTILAQSWAGILRQDWVAAHNGFPGLDVTGTNPAVWGAWNDPSASPLDDYPVGTGGKVMEGTGPYRFDYWTPDVEYSVVRHVNYWGGWPNALPGAGGAHPDYPGSGYTAGWFERGTIKFIDEWATRKLLFLAGDLDQCYVPRGHIPELIVNWVPGSFTAPDPEELPPGLRVDKDLPLLVASPFLFFSYDIDPASIYLGPGFDPADPTLIAGDRIPTNFWSDIDVRKAFAYSFDYDAYIREYYFSEASRAITPIVEGLKYHNPAQTGYNFDLTAAEEHMKLAFGGTLESPGPVWTNGFTFTALYNTGNVARQTANQMIEAAIESLNPNFEIVVEAVPWPTYLTNLVTAKLTMFVLGWLADYPDPHNFAHPFMHSTGAFADFQGFNEPYVDALIEEGIATPDADPRREEIYFELQSLYVELCPGVGLAKPVGRHWERTWAMGWYYNPIYPGVYGYDKWKGWWGDTNKDYYVDIDDLFNVLIGYGETIAYAMATYGVPAGTDTELWNADGEVDLDDLFNVLIEYG